MNILKFGIRREMMSLNNKIVDNIKYILLFCFFGILMVGLVGIGYLFCIYTTDISEPTIFEYTSEYNNTNACIYGCNTMFEKLTNTDLDDTTEQTYEEKKCVDICIDNYF